MGIYRRAKTNLIHYYYSKGTFNHVPYESPKFYYIASDLDARAKMYQHARQFEIHMRNQTKISTNSNNICLRAVKKMKDSDLNEIPTASLESKTEELNHEELDDVFELNFADFEFKRS